jgi:hypothetical protein
VSAGPGPAADRLAAPATAAAMVAMTWTRLGAPVLSWPAILLTAVAGLRADRLRVATAAASVWMLAAMPADRLGGAVLGAVLLATSALWVSRALRAPRTDAGCHALMGLGMAAMLLAQNA